MIGGLALFLFGMSIMGQALERTAGNKLRDLLGKMTNNRFAGLLTGLGVTAVIQSSSATTVMVVGFVNSGLMTLRQAINVIVGANVGTTVTAWILSLSGIGDGNLFVRLLKPSSFSPVLALIGIILYMFCKGSKKKDVGTILLGFATLMFGMETMSGAVKGLAEVEAFTNLFLLFKNPILGVFAGALITAIIQSSSASVGILQALAISGQVSYGAAVPIIMGQNIGTCVTALISSTGANKNAKRAAFVHLFFNIIGTAICLTIFSVVNLILVEGPFRELIDSPASAFGIAVAHSIFNIVCTAILLPMSSLLEKLVVKLVPEGDSPEKRVELDERLFATPALALAQCKTVAYEMADIAICALKDSLDALTELTPELSEKVREAEAASDHYEDILGTYLVKLSTLGISENDSREAAMLIRAIGDFERISDHSVNIIESFEELQSKKIEFSDEARRELGVLTAAVSEILDMALNSFKNEDTEAAFNIESLEEVIDEIKEKLRTKHIGRLQKNSCSIEAGFIWSDLLTNLERVSDHCSNIAGGVIDYAHKDRATHESLRAIKSGKGDYKLKFEEYAEKYSV